MILEHLTQQARELLLAMPEVTRWPALADRIAHFKPGSSGVGPWDYLAWACMQAGGKVEDAVPGLAAIYTGMESIRLVDDILDEDPEGLQHTLGAGPVANLAQALQSLGLRALLETPVEDARRTRMAANYSEMILNTTYGQHRDHHANGSEADYWEMIALKTPPLYAHALYLGATLGGAPQQEAQALASLAPWIGQLTQISDDLHDILQTEVDADWLSPQKNLALIYALNTEHPHQEAFRALLPRVSEPGVLPQLQQIIISSGALSYALSKMAELYREVMAATAQLPSPFDRSTPARLDYYAEQIIYVLSKTGITLTREDLLETVL